jgi:pimeloyl-ACP methyl ester carboxylesterase
MPVTGPTVYLVHGLLESSHGHYVEQIKALRDDYRLVPVDLPGHGRSPVPARAPFYRTATAYFTAVLDRLGPGHVVAASYVGVPVVVAAARTRPDLVWSLVLQGFVPDLDYETFAGWMDGFDHLGELADHHPVMAEGYERVHGKRWKETLRLVLADMRDSYAERIKIPVEALSRLEMPVLLVNGSVRTVERSAASAAERAGGNLRGRVVTNAGHLPGRQQPEEFNELVRSFWREHAWRKHAEHRQPVG